MNHATCQDCQHFLQHYALDKKKIFRVYCGHCTFHRAKKKYPDAKACEHFVPAPADSDAFVTKEFLSKELLRYMLRLELLPEQIEDLRCK